MTISGNHIENCDRDWNNIIDENFNYQQYRFSAPEAELSQPRAAEYLHRAWCGRDTVWGNFASVVSLCWTMQGNSHEGIDCQWQFQFRPTLSLLKGYYRSRRTLLTPAFAATRFTPRLATFRDFLFVGSLTTTGSRGLATAVVWGFCIRTWTVTRRKAAHYNCIEQ